MQPGEYEDDQLRLKRYTVNQFVKAIRLRLRLGSVNAFLRDRRCLLVAGDLPRVSRDVDRFPSVTVILRSERNGKRYRALVKETLLEGVTAVFEDLDELIGVVGPDILLVQLPSSTWEFTLWLLIVYFWGTSFN